MRSGRSFQWGLRLRYDLSATRPFQVASNQRVSCTSCKPIVSPIFRKIEQCLNYPIPVGIHAGFVLIRFRAALLSSSSW
jgi:hypothetical protein